MAFSSGRKNDGDKSPPYSPLSVYLRSPAAELEPRSAAKKEEGSATAAAAGLLYPLINVVYRGDYPLSIGYPLSLSCVCVCGYIYRDGRHWR